jgi:hypothetical protein
MDHEINHPFWTRAGVVTGSLPIVGLHQSRVHYTAKGSRNANATVGLLEDGSENEAAIDAG